MKKIKILLLLFIFVLIYVYVASITLTPNDIVIWQGEKLKLATLWGINIEEKSSSNPNVGKYRIASVLQASSEDKYTLEQVGKINLSINLFKNIALKNIKVSVIPKTTVIPLGNAIGLKLYTKGVLVVGMSEIDGVKPYENTGIEEGDRIIAVNNIVLSKADDLIDIVNEAKGNTVKVKYVGDNKEEKIVEMVPAKTKNDEYKLGLWVRDAAAGVGTLTFYEPKQANFASLGHGITDIDTGNLITIANGELVTSNIVEITKGKKGEPGEIRGSIQGGNKIGTISKNTSFGVFGNVENKNYLNITEKEMEVLPREKIQTGKAQIICELEKGKKKYYDIEIKKVYTANNENNKSMLIKVTDEELIEKTGGIVQGMSGSPIIQNNKFVGAVTHVLVNDPTTGYGVFADMMLKQM